MSKDGHVTPGVLCVALCLLLTGCSDLVARVGAFPDGCRLWAFDQNVQMTQAKNEKGFTCTIEYTRPK